MGDLVRLFPTPPASDRNDTGEVWRGCWACGLLLFDDEPTLCTDCDARLNNQPAPTPAKGKPLGFYLKSFGPDGIALMAAAITETGVAQAEEHAAAWAADHHLDEKARSTYVGDVRGRALAGYSDRCQRDVQHLGEQLNWDIPRGGL